VHKENGQARVIEHALPLAKCKKWPPDFSSLSPLGFDSVSVSRRGALARRVQGTDISGRPFLFVELQAERDRLVLRYSCPAGFDERIRRLNACLMLLYVLQAQPEIRPDPPALAALISPSLESASQVASSQYEQLFKKCADLLSERAELSSQNSRLLRASEEAASNCLALEQALSRLQSRIAALEAVPDAALRELLLEWLSTHRGTFDAPACSRSLGIPAARCEEGLEMLLKSGAIRKTGAHAYAARQGEKPRQFELVSGRMAGLLENFGTLLKKRGG
jgi:hypothetical protein